MLQLLAHEAAAGGRRVARSRQQGAEIAAPVRVVDLFEADGIKLALGRADAAANALVLVEHHGAAAEAASGLTVQLRVGEQAVFCCLPGRGLQLVDCNADAAARQRLIIPLVAADHEALVAVHEAVDRDRGLAALGDRARNVVRTGRSAAGKDSNLDEAELILAEMYLKGIGTTQNFGKGINAYKAAVQQGNTEAYMKLADIYAKGKITPTNLIMAHALYNIAAVQEEPDAAKYRDAIGTKLKLEELQQAQAEAQNFKPKPSELTLFIRRTFGFDIRSYIDMNVLTPKGNK